MKVVEETAEERHLLCCFEPAVVTVEAETVRSRTKRRKKSWAEPWLGRRDEDGARGGTAVDGTLIAMAVMVVEEAQEV